MSDNTTLNPGTGGDVVATDDIAGVKHQQVKVEWGIDGTATPVSAANPMPVVQTGTHAVNATLAAETTKVIGTVNVAAAQTIAATNAGTFVTQENGAALTALQLIDNIVAVEDAVAGSGYSGVPVLAVRQDSQTALAADGDFISPTIDSAGGLRVSIVAGAGSGGTATADDADFTAGTTQGTIIQGIYESSPTYVTDGDVGAVGITATRALKVSIAGGGIAGIADDAAFTPGTSEVLPIGFTFDDSSPDSVNEGDIGAARMSANRNQYVTIRDAAGNERGLNVDASGQVAITLAAAQTLATVTTVSTVTNVATIGTSVTPGTAAANLGKAEDAAHTTGDVGVMALGVRTDTLAAVATTTGDYIPFITDSVGAVWTRDSGELADDAAFTPGTSRVLPVGLKADESGTDSIDEGDIGAARMTLDRKTIVTQYAHAAAGGASNYTALSTAAVLTAEIKSSAGKVFSLECYNINAAARFVRLYNQTGAPASTDTANVVWQGVIPGAATGGGFTISWPLGKQFSTGIGIRATTGIAHNSTGALAADELTFNVSFI